MAISTGAALLGSALIGGGASLLGASKASKAQQKAAQLASETQLRMFDTTRGDLLPTMQFGHSAIPVAQNLLFGNPDQIQAQLVQMPGYQFARRQGLKTVQNSASARGLGVSGPAMMRAAEYVTGLADQTYGAQVNRLMDAIKTGASAAAHSGQYGTQTGQSIGENITGAGNAQGAAWISGANAVGNAAGQVGNLYMMNQMMKSGGYNPLFGGQAASQMKILPI